MLVLAEVVMPRLRFLPAGVAGVASDPDHEHEMRSLTNL